MAGITFSFLWKFTTLDEKNVRVVTCNFVNKYTVDVSEELIDEGNSSQTHLYVKAGLSLFQLLNTIRYILPIG